MESRVVTVLDEKGIHTRPASIFVREAAKFESEIALTVDGASVNGKSIMGILMLAIGPGTEVTLSADGSDESAAVEELAKVLSSLFNL